MTTTTVKEAPALDVVKELLINELTEYSQQNNGKLRGQAIVTCFKNVICMDLRSDLKSMPASLLAAYDLAFVHSEELFALEAVVGSVSKVRG